MKQGIWDYKTLSEHYDLYRYTSEEDMFIDTLRQEKFEHLLSPSQSMVLLDVGTGTGSGLTFFHDKVGTIIGLDGTIEMLARAKEKMALEKMENAGLIHANALSVPLPDNSVDAVISLNFIHLFVPVQKQRPFFHEMERVVKPGGMLVIEFDNALLGVFLGVYRKYCVKDIGYNWPWDLYRLPSTTRVAEILGYSLPGTKKLCAFNKTVARAYSKLANVFPLKYFANRVLVKFTKVS